MNYKLVFDFSCQVICNQANRTWIQTSLKVLCSSELLSNLNMSDTTENKGLWDRITRNYILLNDFLLSLCFIFVIFSPLRKLFLWPLLKWKQSFVFIRISYNHSFTMLRLIFQPSGHNFESLMRKFRLKSVNETNLQ